MKYPTKIEMLDDSGNVTEEIANAHVCVGDCPQGPAHCEDCGAPGTVAIPVYTWTTEIGMDYFVCGSCLSGDSYARLGN
jgi:hypothetical protein